MCGIAGMLCGPAFRDDATDVARMLAALRHRGPDDEGLFSARVRLAASDVPYALALGTTRLSLMDMAGGVQPFRGRRGSRLVFNGEIFNWDALRTELIADGWQPRTRSDTEIVAELFERYGAEAAAKLDGMFALAFWDGHRLLIARDPFGIKPVYFAWSSAGWLAFASEAKALLRARRVEPRLSSEALFETSVFGYPLEQSSLFAGIEQVAPGTVVDVRGGQDGRLQLHTTVVGSFPWHSEGEAATKGDSLGAEALQDEFIRAVGEQLVADHPVGIFLSGGLDSSAILAAALAEGQKELHTFSLGEGDDAGDLDAARRVAELMRSTHHEVMVGVDDFADAIPRAVRALEAPRPPTGGEFLAREARKHAKAALCGEGSDELFGGYWVHMRPRACLRTMLGQYVSAFRRVGAGDDRPRARSTQLLRWLADRDEEELARRVWLVELRSQLMNGHLVPWDHATMSESLELRVPYLSQRLAHIMRARPADALQPSGMKPPVRALVRRLMPAEAADLVLSRPKIAFPSSTRDTARQLGGLAASIVPEAHRETHPLKRVLPLSFSADSGGPNDPVAVEAESLGVLLLDMFVLIFCVHRGDLPDGLSIHTLYRERSFSEPLEGILAEAGRSLGGPVEGADEVELLRAALG